MKRYVALLCISLLFIGCAQIQTASDVIHKLSVADVQSALGIATKYNHRAGMQCYPVLLRYLQTEQITVEIKGVVSAFELAHVTLNDYTTTVEEDIHLACAPLVVEATKTAAGLALKFGLQP